MPETRRSYDREFRAGAATRLRYEDSKIPVLVTYPTWDTVAGLADAVTAVPPMMRRSGVPNPRSLPQRNASEPSTITTVAAVASKPRLTRTGSAWPAQMAQPSEMPTGRPGSHPIDSNSRPPTLKGSWLRSPRRQALTSELKRPLTGPDEAIERRYMQGRYGGVTTINPAEYARATEQPGT